MSLSSESFFNFKAINQMFNIYLFIYLLNFEYPGSIWWWFFGTWDFQHSITWVFEVVLNRAYDHHEMDMRWVWVFGWNIAQSLTYEQIHASGFRSGLELPCWCASAFWMKNECMFSHNLNFWNCEICWNEIKQASSFEIVSVFKMSTSWLKMKGWQ